MSEERLPMADAAPPPPVQVETSSVRMVGTLAVAGALAGLAIVLVFQWANPRIEAWRAEVLSAAVTEVLAGAERYETVFLAPDGSTLTAGGSGAAGQLHATRAPGGTEGSVDAGESPLAETDTAEMDRVYVGYDDAGRPVGVAMVGAAAGFQDIVRVIFGYDPTSGHVIGMQVLESKETPGLGDKIHHDSAFIGEFDRVASPLVGVKPGRETGAEEEVTMITGATISSEAVIDIINARLEEVGTRVHDVWDASSVSSTASGPEPAATPPPAAGGGVP